MVDITVAFVKLPATSQRRTCAEYNPKLVAGSTVLSLSIEITRAFILA